MITKLQLILDKIGQMAYGEQGFSKKETEYGYRSCARDLLAFIESLEVKEEIFSEFEMSEDERVRKALVDYFNNANKVDENPLQNYGIHTDKVIAWLEKIKR